MASYLYPQLVWVVWLGYLSLAGRKRTWVKANGTKCRYRMQVYGMQNIFILCRYYERSKMKNSDGSQLFSMWYWWLRKISSGKMYECGGYNGERPKKRRTDGVKDNIIRSDKRGDQVYWFEVVLTGQCTHINTQHWSNFTLKSLLKCKYFDLLSRAENLNFFYTISQIVISRINDIILEKSPFLPALSHNAPSLAVPVPQKFTLPHQIITLSEKRGLRRRPGPDR